MSKFSTEDEVNKILAAVDIGTKAVHEEFGLSLSINYPLREVDLPGCWLRPLVERYGLVIVKGQTDLIDDPESYLETVKKILGDPCDAIFEDAEILRDIPEIQVFGSVRKNNNEAGDKMPNATFIPARSAETETSLQDWLEKSIPCHVTDWHSDEPWEENPVKFTLALSAVSTGPNATLFCSTVALYDRMDDETKSLLDGTKTSFSPPPWLVLENEFPVTASHSTVQTSPYGKSVYICIDSTKSIDGIPDDRVAKKLVWNLTKDCMKPSHVYTHQWERGDLLFWDDTRTLHSRSEYSESDVDRVLYRMRVMGKEIVDESTGESSIVYSEMKDERGIRLSRTIQ